MVSAVNPKKPPNPEMELAGRGGPQLISRPLGGHEDGNMARGATLTVRVWAHCLGMTAATAGILLGTLLPFLPGRYDSLAVPVSAMFQIFGTVGLLLVPVGALWVASGYWSRLAGKQYGIAIAALIASSVVWLIVSLGALMSSLLLGLGVIGPWIYVVSRVLPRLKLLKSATPRPTSAAAFYLLIVPVAVALLQMAVASSAVEFSRNLAITNSAELIREIEEYRNANGHYPSSLLAEHQDYEPSVIGIKQYYYEPSGDAYNLSFEQPTFLLANPGTREFVVYNKRDEQTIVAHDSDILRWTPEELQQRRGWYAVHDAPRAHWKYFWLD